MDAKSNFYLYTASAGTNERLDVWLTERLDLSRSQIKSLIDGSDVLVNGKAAKAGYRVKDGDQVSITIPEPQELDLKPQDIPIDIVYEDADLVVINKQKDLVVHPAAGNWDQTLVNGLLYRLDDLSGIGGKLRPGIVHRLDKDTSGLMVVAKNDRAHRYLAGELKARRVERHYLALVNGVISTDKGVVDAPIGRHPKDRKKMAVVDGGRHALTHFTVLERYPRYTLVECRLETGRTHQIRVHMAAIRHPIVGDVLYNKRSTQLGATSQALHAFYLAFNHLDGRFVEFRVNPPQEFLDLIEKAKLES